MTREEMARYIKLRDEENRTKQEDVDFCILANKLSRGMKY